jgi:hypothetical protein
MWGWAEAKATTSSAPVEEEEEEMADPPRAMEEEEEGPDEPEEEEEDDSDNREDSTRIDDDDEEQDGGPLSGRRLGPYVTQRLPGIRSIYSGSARARHARRQIPDSSRKFDPEPRINGEDLENASASGSEYNSSRKKKPSRSRPPPSAALRKRKGSPARESSGSDHPPPLGRKSNKVLRQDEPDEDPVSDLSAKSDDQDTVNSAPPIPASPSKFLPGTKPLSAIATSSINSAATALAALAAIADSVENTTETVLELKNLSTLPQKSPIRDPPSATNASSSAEVTLDASRSRTLSPDNSDGDEEATEPQPAYSRNKRTTRRAPPRSRKASEDWRRLGKPPARMPNSKKPSVDLKIDTTLDVTSDRPVVEAINDDAEAMEVDADPDEVNDTEKNADLEVEEEEAEEEASQHDEEAQPIEDAGEVEDDPADPEGEGDGEEDQEQDVEANEVENDQENDNENENDDEEIEEEPSPEGDLEDQEIELQPAHRAEALDVLASIELKFAMLRERVYVEKMEILAWEEAMIQACESFCVPFLFIS